MISVLMLVTKKNTDEMVGLALGCVGLFGVVRGGARVRRGRRR